MESVALEMEHGLGFTANLQGIAFHPRPDKSTVLYGCGKLLVISDLDNAHEQRLLRGHDAQITCIDVSSTGSLIASGQQQSLDGFVYYNIWDFDTAEVRHRVQTPHKGACDAIRFSPDEALIATTGAEGSLCIWDAVSGKKIASYQDTLNGDEAKSLRWGEIYNSGTRNQQYTLFVPFNTGVRICKLSFSIKTLAFELDCQACHLPGAGGRMGGYVRKYRCCASIGLDLLCGTSSGDLLVYNAESGLYRTALTLCANGINALVQADSHRCVFVGGGDGTLKKISGSEKEWALQGAIQLEGSIVSMASSSDDAQIVAITTAGLIYRVLTADMTYTVAAEAPLNGLNDIALSAARPDIFASVSNDGIFRLWDLNEYTIVSQFTLATNVRSGQVADVPIPTSCAFDPEPHLVVTGWSDGRIRCIDTTTKRATLAWTMSNGHKGKVHTVRVCTLYIVTAGDDSCVRVWSRSSKELMTQLQEHKLPVTAAHIDNTTTSILHSISLDMSHCAFDLSKVNNKPNVKGPKCIASHSFSGCGGFTCITQRADNEHEIIIGTMDGKLLFFDLDFPQPVLTIVDKNRIKVTSCEVSPNGRFLVAGLADGSLVVYQLSAVSEQGKTVNRCDLVLHAVCHSSAVARCSWTADNKQIISAGGDGELIMWNFYTKDS